MHTLRGLVARLDLLSKVKPRRRWTLSRAWRELWETDPPVLPLRLTSGDGGPKVRRITPSLLTSSLLHFSVVFFLYSLPFALMRPWLAAPSRVPTQPHMIEIQHLNLADYLPVFYPPGHTEAPKHRAKPGARPRLGSTHFDPRITIISNPPHPDNFRVTLRTENAPPDLKPPLDSKIPDLIFGGLLQSSQAAGSLLPPPPKPETPTAPAPLAVPPPKPEEAQAPTPPMKPAAPAPAIEVKLPELPAPHLEVPSSPPAVSKAPVAEAASTSPKSAPQEPPHAAEHTPPEAPTPAPAAGEGGAKPGGGPMILALSVEPAPLKDVAAIPAGVRAGAFSISPAGPAPGSPDRARGAPPEVGEGGHLPGVEKSAAGGNESAGPGGGGPPRGPAAPAVSVSGSGGSTGIAGGTLPPLRPEDLVYAVKPETPKARAPSIVVSSGASGGGGLRIYGVLHGDKIYTVYFSMPGKSWILQYCAHEPAAQVDASARVVQIHISPPLAPPAAIEQFDFRRPQAPSDAGQPMIILHGFIHEDGTVSDLAALEGSDPASNAAACAAFSRWKFKPALRAGVPVALEILVGIP